MGDRAAPAALPHSPQKNANRHGSGTGIVARAGAGYAPVRCAHATRRLPCARCPVKRTGHADRHAAGDCVGSLEAACQPLPIRKFKPVPDSVLRCSRRLLQRYCSSCWPILRSTRAPRRVARSACSAREHILWRTWATDRSSHGDHRPVAPPVMTVTGTWPAQTAYPKGSR
jgi:hypothetical protein